jgi:hypothetical protein
MKTAKRGIARPAPDRQRRPGNCGGAPIKAGCVNWVRSSCRPNSRMFFFVRIISAGAELRSHKGHQWVRSRSALNISVGFQKWRRYASVPERSSGTRCAFAHSEAWICGQGCDADAGFSSLDYICVHSPRSMRTLRRQTRPHFLPDRRVAAIGARHSVSSMIP